MKVERVAGLSIISTFIFALRWWGLFACCVIGCADILVAREVAVVWKASGLLLYLRCGKWCLSKKTKPIDTPLSASDLAVNWERISV